MTVMRTVRRIECVMEKLVFGGQALGRYQGKVVFAWNALPEEKVVIRLTRQKKDFIEGIAEEVLQSSPHRIAPVEEHYLSCSPWQILEVSEEERWKVLITEEVFRQIGKFEPGDLQLVQGQHCYGYRNKMEFSFTKKDGKISLAFFKRAGRHLIPIDGCILARSQINETARKVVLWLNEIGISFQRLKSLVVKASEGGKCLAALFVKDENIPLGTLPVLDDIFIGFSVFYSNPQSPASTADKLIARIGCDELREELAGFTLKHNVMSFFQVNLPLFRKAHELISRYVDRSRLIDFYGGVGAISIPLGDKASEAILIDNDENAINCARKNIEINNVGNFKVVLSPAEKARQVLDEDSIVIVDPPRAGLHPKLVKALLMTPPKRLIYLSCNPSTQARDVSFLLNKFEVRKCTLFNFFPRTPHVESLMILDRRSAAP